MDAKLTHDNSRMIEALLKIKEESLKKINAARDFGEPDDRGFQRSGNINALHLARWGLGELDEPLPSVQEQSNPFEQTVLSEPPLALFHANWLERSLTIGAAEAGRELRRLYEENLFLKKAQSSDLVAWACWPDGFPLDQDHMQLSKEEPRAYPQRIMLAPTQSDRASHKTSHNGGDESPEMEAARDFSRKFGGTD